MAISFPCGSVTQAGWNVSRTLSADLPKGGRLSVFRGWHGHDAKGFPKFRRGDHDGRTFETDSEYESFVRSRGYVQPYFRSAATFKAMHRAELRQWSRELVAPIMAAESRADIAPIAADYKARVIAAGCGILEAMTFGNGAYAAARRLRPDLFARMFNLDLEPA